MFCLALSPLSGSGEGYHDYWLRLKDLWQSVSPVWCWDKVPNPQTYWNAYLDAICCWSDAGASYFHAFTPIYRAEEEFPVYGSIASNFPSSGHVFPFLDFPPNWQGFPYMRPIENFRPVYLFDPSFPVGSSVPIGWGSYSGLRVDPPATWERYTQTNRMSDAMLVGRAYVLPQRVFVTNGWNYGTNSLLWDMYGDGRMFLPRLVAECGFVSQHNVLPFDASLWEQLHFRGEYTRSKTVTSSIDLPFLSSTPGVVFTNAIWWDGVTRRANSANASISVVVTNQNLFGTNMLSPSQFPYVYELFGLPSAGASQSDYSWRFMRYVPDSIQHGDFGVALRTYRPDWSPSEWADFGKGGIRGLCFAPVSRANGATLRFARFVFQPIPRSRTSEPFGRLTIYVPSGLAWDNDGGCCFNWSKDGQPLSSLFKWPLTAAWDYSYQMDIATNGNNLSASGAVSVHTNIDSRIPSKDPSPPDNVPPLPSPPRGGTVSSGGGGGGGGTTFLPFNPSGESFSFTSGIILNSSTATGGSGGRDTPIASSSLTYQNTASTVAVDDSGDLVGEYKLNLPTYSDFYTWGDLEDRNALDFTLSHDLAIQAGWLDNDSLWDWAPAGPADGQLGSVLEEWQGVGYVDGNGPELQGFAELFDTSGEWWYEHLSYDPIFPRINTLVLPWPEHTADGWDWSATRTFELPEQFAEYRTLLFWAFGVGLSLLFVALVMALFSRGAN